MRVTVLGGGGFIGSHLAARLVRDGHDVTAVVDRRFPELRQEWWGAVPRRWQLDLRVLANAMEAVKSADYVFHLAADMGGAGYFHSSADGPAAQKNMQIDLNVLEACQLAEVPFFYSSSACAYPKVAPVTGLHEGLLGLGPAEQLYGEEKRMMTLMCQREELARVGIFHTIYGPGQESDGPRAKFPPAICQKVKRGGEIEIWGDGSQVRTFLYIEDAIERILRVAWGPYEGPVNIGSDEAVTVRQCADWLCEYAGVEPNYRFDLSKPTGVMVRESDNRTFDRLYGPLSLTSAREGLIRLFDWLP